MSHPEVSRKFHFLREIASGGFGSVFLAKVIHTDGFSRLAAIKLLHPKWSENEEIASRMRDEARLLGQLRHRNIVDVADLTMIDGRVAVIMEYLEAVDLRAVINDCIAHGELVPTRASLELGTCVASALDAAYNRPPIPGEKPLRVIHRDIKPSNVMIDESGTPKVLDFGVARADFEERESHTQEVAFGSIEYMPPERLFFEPESPASDVYSLGATLYELMALEKFGKAKLRPNQHEELIFKRLRYLFGRNPMRDDEVRNQVKSLLRDMLAFDEADRPTAVQCVERFRAITRLIRREETMTEWAEVVIPPLVEAHRNQQRDGPPNPLVDQVVEEDSKGFRRTPTEELFSDKSIPPEEEVDFDGAPEDDDLRWRALKEATLAEITAANAPPPVPMGMRSVNPNTAMRSDLATATPAPPRGMLQERQTPEEQEPADPAPRKKGGAGRVVAGGLALAALAFMVVAVAVVGIGVGLSAGAFSDGALTLPGMDGPVPDQDGGTVLAAPEPSDTAAPGAGPVLDPAEAPAPEDGVTEEGGTAEVAPEPAAEPEPAPEPAPPPEPVEVPTAEQGTVLFVSAKADAKKLTARCDGGRAEGSDRVVMGAADIGDCTITFIGQDRSRATAVVRDVQEGTYVCFESGDKSCKIGDPAGG